VIINLNGKDAFKTDWLRLDWYGFAWLGMAWHGLAWTRHGLAWLGRGMAWLGRGMAWMGRGMAWLGMAWMTSLGMNMHGLAGQDQAVLAAEIFQVQVLSNSQAPSQDCEQIQGDMDPSLITAGSSLPLHHDSEIATVSDPRVSLKYRGGNATGNVKTVVPLVVTPAVLSALSVEYNNTQTLTAQTPQADIEQIQIE
jgi:hypothetical protein